MRKRERVSMLGGERERASTPGREKEGNLVELQC
jgi:hypothetical protein